MSLALLLHPIPVHTDSGDEDGMLVLANGRLTAVLVRLRDEAHVGLIGGWFLEAGFGPCAHASAPIFTDLDAAREWVGCQFKGCEPDI